MRRICPCLAGLSVVSLLVLGIHAFGDPKSDVTPVAPERKVSLNLRNVPLGNALIRAARAAKLSVILDPSARVDGKPAKDARVSLKSNQLTGTEFIRGLVEPLWLETESVDGLLFIRNASFGRTFGRRGPIGVMDPDVPDEMIAKLLAAKVTREGPAPLRKATEELVRGSGFTLRYDLRYHKAGDGPVTSFAVHDLPLKGWLTAVSRSEGFGWTVEGDAIVITDRARGREFRLEKRLRDTVVSFDKRDAPAMEVARFLQMQTRANIVIDFSACPPTKRVTLKMDGVTAEAAIRGLAAKLGLAPIIRDEMVFLVAPKSLKTRPSGARTSRDGGWLLVGRASPADLAVLEKIRKETVSVEFKNLPLKDALRELGEKGKVKILLSGKTRPVTLKLNDVSVEQVLTMLVGQVGLKCSIIKGKVVVSDEKRIRKASKRGVR